MSKSSISVKESEKQKIVDEQRKKSKPYFDRCSDIYDKHRNYTTMIDYCGHKKNKLPTYPIEETPELLKTYFS